LHIDLPENWLNVIGDQLAMPYFHRLAEFVDSERASQTVFPPEIDVFNALKLTDFNSLDVVILGQDPYHGDHQAHGLCFSVLPGVRPPPSLVNILKELASDLHAPIPKSGCLTPWARQGILLLNTVLTVRAHQPNSHSGRGWETFTDSVIAAVNGRDSPAVFVLWGAHAQKKRTLIDCTRHLVIQSAHPSPLSAYAGFLGSRPFSNINSILRQWGRTEIDWLCMDSDNS